MDYTIQNLEKHEDHRGWLTELLRTDEIGEFNQVYCATIEPGEKRGGHYHKNRKEWFTIVRGDGVFKLWNKELAKLKEVICIPVSGKDLTRIHIPVDMFHEIENTGDSELIFVSAISDLYDKDNSDTYYG